MNIFTWILFGFIVGLLAKVLAPGRDPGGFVATILIGIAGSFIGGYFGNVFGITQTADHAFELASIFVAICGAIIMLFAYRAIAPRIFNNN